MQCGVRILVLSVTLRLEFTAMHVRDHEVETELDVERRFTNVQLQRHHQVDDDFQRQN